MRFHVGPWVYRVEISEGPIFADEGPEAMGLCIPSQRKIILSGVIPVRMRLTTLIHELQHAWVAELGWSGDAESMANRAATFTIAVWRELLRQGGENALMRLTSEGIVDQTKFVPSARMPRGGECPFCGTRFGPHQVRHGEIEFDIVLGKPKIEQIVDCEFCGWPLRWTETLNTNGASSGEIVDPPKLMKQGEASTV